ncbi:LOW QUALITY PROTEIN: armadillo-like helical domain containing protein 1 [Trematomus bernacchii]|uniref:LOW QUALITY PROTEIN: armadillo-like helical domain containing protein 1 n=1 Tax=Trematomus bernacchii TaxID=40690 RepID=UPI00146B52EE|nr:LOW QUALITY PROTEIN: armadillo-like helical domain containing protein 1 [Trematomus bernacchii]
MSTPEEEEANIGKVLTFLREWDRGDSRVRGRMLTAFLSRNPGRRLCDVELQLAQVSSLFLARITTWTRLTYMFGTFLGLQLKAIGIFLSASNHDQYLMEFLDDGGVLTLLDILSHSQSKEEQKLEALRLLLTMSDAGRKYKEVICESHGVKAIAEFLAQSNTDEPLEAAWALLESLSRGNPRYQNQVYKAMIALMTCSSPDRPSSGVLHSLHTVQVMYEPAHHSIVEPLLGLLSSLHLEVQDEAINLILGLRCYEVRPLLLDGLVALLRPTKENVQHQNMQESEIIQMTGSLPVFVQQAAAAKSIRYLAGSEDSQEVSRELLSLGVIQRLLYAMGNREHTDAQIQASLALKHFVRSFPNIEDHVQRGIGSTLFAVLMNQADTLYMNMDETQAAILLTNKVNITEVWYGDNSEG